MAKKVFTDESLSTFINEIKSYIDTSSANITTTIEIEVNDIYTYNQTVYDSVIEAISEGKTVILYDTSYNTRYLITNWDFEQNYFTVVTLSGFCTWWGSSQETDWGEFVTIDDAENDYARTDHTHDEYLTSDDISSLATTTYVDGQLGAKADTDHTHSGTEVFYEGVITVTSRLDYLLALMDEKVDVANISSYIPDYITTGAKSGSTIGTKATAEGYNTTASGSYSHAEGNNTTASGLGSHAEGYNTTASNNYAHAEGGNTIASGLDSHAEGSFTTASGDYSHAGGYGTIANDYQHVVGRYNKDTTAPTSLTDTGTSSGLFIVGIGSSEDARSNGFRVSAGGKVYGTGVFGTSGADYAEYFEWFDGNPNNEDRRGYFVTLDGGKIRYATSNDDYILGVVSANPSVAGDIQSESWHDMYLKDIYGSKIVEVVEVEETVNKNGEIIPAHTESRWVLNPNYNPNVKYTSREERPEWAAIGIVGKLVVVDDGTCQVNGYCYPSVDGIATASQDKTNYRVMERLDDTHIRIFIR